MESSWPRTEPAAAAGSQLDELVGEGGDLNKVDEDALKAAKAAMQVDFEKNAVRPGDEPTFLQGRCAEVIRTADKAVVGHFGTVHPEVLEGFDLEFPTSAVDIDLEAFL